MLTKSFFSISLLVAGAFASPAPVQKRQYEADLKAGIVGIGEKWNEIAKLVDNTNIPSINGSGIAFSSIKPVATALDQLGDYIAAVVNGPMQTNGAFVSEAEAQAYVDDVRANGPTAVKVMQVVINRSPQVMDIGKLDGYGVYLSALDKLAWAYG
ncbi:hypothetical protein BT69DRAFT_1323342, partial [Atractiella rhizophila]